MSSLPEMFRPPSLTLPTLKTLDRALFTKTIPLSCARINDLKSISKYRAAFLKSRDLLRVERIGAVVDDPDAEIARRGGKCLLLDSKVQVGRQETWSEVLKESVEMGEVGVVECEVKLGYDYWNYLDIMQAVLPADAQGEIPVGFAIVGHVAHLNLRDEYLPYKHLIASVLIDKNPNVKTVINKIDTVGQESQFRTFSYEVLGGPDDMLVELREGDCTFKFDYSKVYWNSRLQTEHKRLVDLFKKGEVVVDLMAGIGPFAVPAGKKGVFVWANDLNPESFEAMKVAVKLNKVGNYVYPHCEDAATFIHTAAKDLLDRHANGTNTVTLAAPTPSRRTKAPSSTSPSSSVTTTKTASTQPIITPSPAQASKTLTIPSTISHFVMNLPASAISFLPSFSGLYATHEKLFSPFTSVALPLIHVHCFSTKSEDNIREGNEIAERISHELGIEMRFVGLGKGDGSGGTRDWVALGEREILVHDVRDVAPLKRMFCATFRLPGEVAFRERL